ncbi:MAG: DUF1836 domain-containing protein [Lachnospiraceae bacterium]|nr:DUF1836 domain-containing protein [Lachnospiraceae bacterium]
MSINIEELLKEWIKLDYILPEDVPEIELYMDQVTTFMEQKLKNNNRYEDDKTLTKTMINNYTKNHLLPPPVKKKYSKNHIYLLIYIYYLKNFLSINDISILLAPLMEHFSEDDALEHIYQTIFNLEREHTKVLKTSIEETYQKSLNTFSGENKEYLEQLSFISLLSYDIYLKKQIVEKLIDEMSASIEETKQNKKEKKSAKEE